jgi:flavodoxin/ferredoxin
MRTLIICFSQTGNTKKVAENIRDGISEITGSCNIVSLDEVDRITLKDYDLVGLGCPVFYYKEPHNVSMFIENLPELKSKQWFVFCSHGSVMGLTLISMIERLEKKGVTVIGTHHTYADGSLPFYPYPTLTTGHPDAHDLREARDFGKSIAICSKAVADGDSSRIKKPDSLKEEWVKEEAAMLTIEFMDQAMPKLSINKEICVQCGKCQEACPAKGIDVASAPPRIQNPCIYCWYCVKICPTCAIEADWNILVNMAPGNYARYINVLKAAEEKGEFRWLIDPNDIDYDDPLFKQREREVKAKKE